MRITALLLALSACSTYPKCPVAAPSAPVTIIAPRPRCVLPMLAEPIENLGTPDHARDGVFVSREKWALLGGYIASAQEWIVTATECLERE